MINFADLMLARYEENGRGPDVYDCFGLFAELCRRRGVDVPDRLSPADLAKREEDIAEEAEQHWLKLDRPEEGCAVVLRIGPWSSHIGMMLDDRRFIHASQCSGITVTSLEDERWRNRISGFYRYAGVQS